MDIKVYRPLQVRIERNNGTFETLEQCDVERITIQTDTNNFQFIDSDTLDFTESEYDPNDWDDNDDLLEDLQNTTNPTFASDMLMAELANLQPTPVPELSIADILSTAVVVPPTVSQEEQLLKDLMELN